MEHPGAQITPARGEPRSTAGRRGRRALAGADHIGMQGVLRLRQVWQKKAEVHAESPRVSPSGGRLGEESQQTRLRAEIGQHARRLTSAGFPQGISKGSGITDNCHCRTSELLIVTAASEASRTAWPCATRVAVRASASVGLKRRIERQPGHKRSDETNRAASANAHGAISALRCAMRTTCGGAGSTLKRVHEDLLLDAHHLPGWQDGG